jgi:hypothetical protein
LSEEFLQIAGFKSEQRGIEQGSGCNVNEIWQCGFSCEDREVVRRYQRRMKCMSTLKELNMAKEFLPL